MHNRNYLPSLLTIAWSLILLLFLTVTACGVLGYENVDTTRKAIVVANAEVTAANLLLQDLIVKRLVTESQARDALADLRVAHDHLQTGLDAVDLAGDPLTADTNLQRANAALSVVMKLLAPLVENEP